MRCCELVEPVPRRRASSATVAPSAARARAVASPIPLLAPGHQRHRAVESLRHDGHHPPDCILARSEPERRPMTDTKPPLPALRQGQRDHQGPGRGGRVEHLRPAPGERGVHRGFAVAQPRPVRHRPCCDRRAPHRQVGARARLRTAQEPVELRRESDRRCGSSTMCQRRSARPVVGAATATSCRSSTSYGLMRRREASINDVAIDEADRRFFGATPGFRTGPGHPVALAGAVGLGDVGGVQPLGVGRRLRPTLAASPATPPGGPTAAGRSARSCG